MDKIAKKALRSLDANELVAVAGAGYGAAGFADGTVGVVTYADFANGCAGAGSRVIPPANGLGNVGCATPKGHLIGLYIPLVY